MPDQSQIVCRRTHHYVRVRVFRTHKSFVSIAVSNCRTFFSNASCFGPGLSRSASICVWVKVAMSRSLNECGLLCLLCMTLPLLTSCCTTYLSAEKRVCSLVHRNSDHLTSAGSPAPRNRLGRAQPVEAAFALQERPCRQRGLTPPTTNLCDGASA